MDKLLFHKGDLVKIDGIVRKIAYTQYPRYWGRETYVEVKEERCKPIPLTNNILSKNSWKNDMAGNRESKCWTNNYVRLYEITKNRGGGYLFLYSGNHERYIHYVHELQHLLEALGFNSNLVI